MSEDRSFADLMTRLRSGDQEAAARIFRRFSRRLVGLARSRLDAVLRPLADPEEAVQSAFKSFFRHHAEGRYELHSWDGLWGLLARITLRKCGHRIDYHLAARRDARRSAALPVDEPAAAWEPIAREPTPSEAAVLAETVERLMRGLDERGRQVLALSLEGYGAPEVADHIGCTERTVYRALRHIRQRLETLRQDDANAP